MSRSCAVLPEGRTTDGSFVQLHAIHVPWEHDPPLSQPGSIGYFCVSRDARWTNHDRVIEIVIYNGAIYSKLAISTVITRVNHVQASTK